MKKIIAAFDGLKFSAGTMDYAIYLAKHFNAHLVGVFLDDSAYTGYGYAQLIINAQDQETMKILDEADKETRDNSAYIFKTHCEESGLHFSIHRDRDTAVGELLHESIYADLLIIDSRESFARTSKEPPSSFIRDILAEIQCPVLLVQPKYKPVEKIIFLYDGEPSSVYAIKMFSYLLMPFKHLPSEVLSVKSEGGSLHLPDNRLMKEFMKRHFPLAEFIVLKGEAEEQIVSYVKEQKECALVVLGAYHRGKVSRWFRPSMADVLMQNIHFPLFVAHSK